MYDRFNHIPMYLIHVCTVFVCVCVFHEVIFHFCTVSAATIEEGAAWLCNGAQPLGLVRKAGLTVKGIRA